MQPADRFCFLSEREREGGCLDFICEVLLTANADLAPPDARWSHLSGLGRIHTMLREPP
jgi:hypothetical protein